jgi:hypothetical protein
MPATVSILRVKFSISEAGLSTPSISEIKNAGFIPPMAHTSS